MHRCALLLAVITLAVLPTPALAQTPANVFCEGTYALCIKAPCQLIPVHGEANAVTTDRASCACDVVQGWSMGPAPCGDREKTVAGRTYLMSTYSNRYNREHKTLFCESQDTMWAWCYGAPCLVDEQNPKLAHCNCPVRQSPAMTLGGDCKTERCKFVWSAATPEDDAIANQNFYKYMTENHPDWPAQPPAVSCQTITKEATGGR